MGSKYVAVQRVVAEGRSRTGVSEPLLRSSTQVRNRVPRTCSPCRQGARAAKASTYSTPTFSRGSSTPASSASVSSLGTTSNVDTPASPTSHRRTSIMAVRVSVSPSARPSWMRPSLKYLSAFFAGPPRVAGRGGACRRLDQPAREPCGDRARTTLNLQQRCPVLVDTYRRRARPTILSPSTRAALRTETGPVFFARCREMVPQSAATSSGPRPASPNFQ